MKVIKFRRLSSKPIIKNGIEINHWEIAFNEKELMEKLDGDMAEIIMPAKPWYIRIYRMLFPLKGTTYFVGGVE